MRGKPIYLPNTNKQRIQEAHKLLELEIGEMVLHTSYYPTGFAVPSEVKIIDIIKKYDEDTGKPYNVYKIKGGQQFDGRNGMPLNPPLAYCIKKIQRKGETQNE